MKLCRTGPRAVAAPKHVQIRQLYLGRTLARKNWDHPGSVDTDDAFARGVRLCPSHAPPYSPKLRRQLVELVRAGRDPEELAREFEPTSQSIRNWVLQADCEQAPNRGSPALLVQDKRGAWPVAY